MLRTILILIAVFLAAQTTDPKDHYMALALVAVLCLTLLNLFSLVATGKGIFNNIKN